MKLNELDLKLQEAGIKMERYYLHGLFGNSDDNDKLSMRVYRGDYSLVFEIYYKENGEKHLFGNFNTEDDACEFFLKKMLKTKEIEEKYGIG